MPYILSPEITENMPGLWGEGTPYSFEHLYQIDGKLPPVNYQAHTLKSHSLTHAEGSLHTNKEGRPISDYFKGDSFFGSTQVLKLKGNNYKLIDKEKGVYHWEVTYDQIYEELGGVIPSKLLLSTEYYPENRWGFHDPNFVLTLSAEAANWLTSDGRLSLYGTSWKSTDFNPGSMERPIHKLIFKHAVILECLDLKNVPSGQYFLVSFPIRLKGASEAPVTPVLFTKNEILDTF